MENVRVLLSVQQHLHSQLLNYFFKSSEGFELIGEAEEVIDILMMIDAKKPDLWIHSWNQDSLLEGVLSHVYSCHPDLTVVRISPDEITGFAQRPIHSIAGLIEFAQSSRKLIATA